MDSSSHIRPKKPLLVIGSMTSSGSSHPKPSGSTSGYSFRSGPKSDSRNCDDHRYNNLPIKKSRTMVDSSNGNEIVVVEPDTPKLCRQFWKAEDEEPVPRYCRSDAEIRAHLQFFLANAATHKWALGALVELLDEDVTQSRDVDRIPDMGLENRKHGHGFSETVSGNEAGELQKVKEESAKLQRQKRQLESQLKDSKCKIQDLEKTHKLKDHSEKLVAELINQLKQSKCKIQDLEKTDKLKDHSEKLVAELINQLKQSTAKIKDLEKMQNVNDDESEKQVAELQRQKALLKEETKKVKDESTKLVAKLQRHKALLEIESEKLKQSEAKNQDLEYKLKNAEDEFFQERAHRDSTEHNLRNRLREAFATIHTLTSKVNSLEGERP